MGEDHDRQLIAWADEMQRVHRQLRAATEIVRDAVESGEPVEMSRDLLLHCWGFCQALGGHHRGEDAVLFVAVREQHPELVDVLARLRQDHSMMEHLISGLAAAVDRDPPERVLQHLDGLGAIMESHFRYEERQLLAPLAGLDLAAAPRTVLGPLASPGVAEDR